jgi:DNA-binding transcriptional ArsR family regulator
MPRRTADTRHALAPATRHELMDLLIAFHHPTRRWLLEILGLEGPASVGRLAARTGLAVGSVSHHLKPLHQQGFIEPAPELARDTRESWWRVVPRSVSWSVEDFDVDSPGRMVADRAEVENVRHQVRAIQQWLSTAADSTPEWRRAAGSTDSLVPATVDQLADLTERLNDVIVAWTVACKVDATEHPEAPRRPVRAVVRTFPTAVVRP